MSSAFNIPAGFALVPMHMTDEMEAVTRDDSWQWEDLLAAAGAITEEQYDDIAAGRGAPAPVTTLSAPAAAAEPTTVDDAEVRTIHGITIRREKDGKGFAVEGLDRWFTAHESNDAEGNLEGEMVLLLQRLWRANRAGVAAAAEPSESLREMTEDRDRIKEWRDLYRDRCKALEADRERAASLVASEDTKRLDWLESNLTWQVNKPEEFDGDEAIWSVEFRSTYGVNETQDDLRPAIDAARASAGEAQS